MYSYAFCLASDFHFMWYGFGKPNKVFGKLEVLENQENFWKYDNKYFRKHCTFILCRFTRMYNAQYFGGITKIPMWVNESVRGDQK